MKINSLEIAKLANVSRATVSRVINNNPKVKPETREKVLKIIKEFDYTPNTNAQTLAGKTNDVIGLFIFDDSTEYNNTKKKYFEYFSKFITRVTQEAFVNNKQLLVDIIVTKEDEVRLEGFFRNRNISCGIILGTKKDDYFVRSLIEKELPLALIDYSSDEKLISENIKLINSNDYKAAYDVTTELIKKGCQKIVHIEGDMDKLSGIERKSGYLDALIDNFIEVDKNLIFNGNYLEEIAVKEMNKFLDKNIEFDGIFAGNDVMAYGVKKILKERNYNKNIEIWGYDNLKTTILHDIKTVDPRLEDLATETIKSLMENNGVGEDKNKENEESEENIIELKEIKKLESEKREIKYIDAELIRDVESYIKHYDN